MLSLRPAIKGNRTLADNCIGIATSIGGNPRPKGRRLIRYNPTRSTCFAYIMSVQAAKDFHDVSNRLENFLFILF